MCYCSWKMYLYCKILQAKKIHCQLSIVWRSSNRSYKLSINLLVNAGNKRDQLEPVAKSAWGNLSPSHKIPIPIYSHLNNWIFWRIWRLGLKVNVTTPYHAIFTSVKLWWHHRKHNSLSPSKLWLTITGSDFSEKIYLPWCDMKPYNIISKKMSSVNWDFRISKELSSHLAIGPCVGHEECSCVLRLLTEASLAVLMFNLPPLAAFKTDSQTQASKLTSRINASPRALQPLKP